MKEETKRRRGRPVTGSDLKQKVFCLDSKTRDCIKMFSEHFDISESEVVRRMANSYFAQDWSFRDLC